MAISKRRLRASDIDKLENTSMASALVGADGTHVESSCVATSCIGVSGNTGTCTGVGLCCTGCSACSGCTLCTARTAPCELKSAF
jgi:hypothetical protein